MFNYFLKTCAWGGGGGRTAVKEMNCAFSGLEVKDIIMTQNLLKILKRQAWSSGATFAQINDPPGRGHNDAEDQRSTFNGPERAASSC